MACMATSTATGNLILSPRPQLRNSRFEGRQVSALSLKAESLRLQGAVNWKVGEKSTRLFATTITRRKARHSPSTLVRNEATAGEPKPDLDQGERDERYSTGESAMLHRREIVWAATGAFSYLSSAGIVHSAVAAVAADRNAVPPTNFAKKDCRLVRTNGPVSSENCCQPDGSMLVPKEFQFEDLPMRVRKPAHILSKDPEYVKKYNEAYRRMKALPDEDPRSFKNQWHIHCAFCVGAYPEPGNSFGTALQYHGSWTFLPWHRMYLYFHERILGELINDPSFALPFWNWDNQREEDGGNQMPLMFTEDRGLKNDHLLSAVRNLEHYPPTHVNLTDPYREPPPLACTPTKVALPPDEGYSRAPKPVDTKPKPDEPPKFVEDYENLRSCNLSLLHSAVISTVSPRNFLGCPYRPNLAKARNEPGSAETHGHGVVHVWTGGRYNPNNEDMGTFIFAARDPIFYTHHANIDRLWSVWQSLHPSSDKATRGGKRPRQEPADPPFGNTQFAFYDHKKDLVVVKIAQTVDSLKLSFKYEAMESDNDWIKFQKKPSTASKPSQSDFKPKPPERTVLPAQGQSSTFRLLRRVPTDTEAEGFTADQVEETLLLKGAKLSMDSFTLYKVFINLPSANANTPLEFQEFAGIISHIPHARSVGNSDPHTSMSTHDHDHTLRLSIGAVVKSLNLPDEESVTVTFVPGGQSEPLVFEDLTTEFV